MREGMRVYGLRTRSCFQTSVRPLLLIALALSDENGGDYAKAREAFVKFLAAEPRTQRSADVRKIRLDLDERKA